ncbi:hypothetical protein FRC12_003769 [Ceratobasidium sp. 428]|nr:hypothetical protein FRC12_003769 [Ceratobasidium sp. 428]
MWIGAFASPSLVNLLITPSEPGRAPTISYEAASVLMKGILPQVPKLEKLGLFPDYEVGKYGDEGESNFLAMLSGDQFYMYITGATSLRHLSGSLAWIDDEPLLVLGQLPYLETITVSSADEVSMALEFKLPEDSFPSLRGLFLHKMNPFFAMPILGLTPLLRGLTSLDLHIVMGLLDEEGVDSDSWLADFFPCLANAPRVENLKIYLEGQTKHEPIEPFEIDEDALDTMSQLPLQYLQLRDLVLGSETLQNMDLDVAWPSLTHLEIPAQSVSLTGLAKFVAIPSLQHLELQLDLQRESVPEYYDLGQSSLVTLVTSKGGKVCSKFADVDFVARALLSMAPRLTCVTWPTPGKNTFKNEILQYERAEILNGYLSSLREINRLQSM